MSLNNGAIQTGTVQPSLAGCTECWDILKGRLKPVPAIAALHPEATAKERE